MLKLIIILFIASVTLFGGTLRILNIPIYSSIKVENKEYLNELKRYIEIDLDEKMFSYDISIMNKNFKTYKFSQSITDEKVAVYTLNMEYAKEYYTNIFVKDVDGRLDNCQEFLCDAKNSIKITSNTYKFKDNLENPIIDFVVSRENYYDETDSYDITKNQKIIIEPVSSWGTFSIGLVAGQYTKESIPLFNDELGSNAPQYLVEDATMYGFQLSYKKNTPFNFFIGTTVNYLTLSESEEDIESTYETYYSGDPEMQIITVGLSLGYKLSSLLLEVGMRQEMLEISKVINNKKYSYEEDEIGTFIALGFKLTKFMTISLSYSELELATTSLQLTF